MTQRLVIGDTDLVIDDILLVIDDTYLDIDDTHIVINDICGVTDVTEFVIDGTDPYH